MSCGAERGNSLWTQMFYHLLILLLIDVKITFCSVAY